MSSAELQTSRDGTDASTRRKIFGLALLLCLLGLWSYRSAYRAPFLFDDLKLIGDRAEYYSTGHLRPLLVKTRRPMLHLSVAANYALGRLDPWGYHAFNVAVHLVAGLALFGVARRTLSMPGIPAPLRRDSLWLALAVAAIWTVHPLQTESVTYVIQRCESMMGMFYLLCLYCVVRGSQSTRPRSYVWYLSAILFFHCGLGSKEVTITALVVLPLYDRIFLSGSWKELVRRRWAFYAGLTPLLIWFGFGLARTFDSTPKTAIGFGVQSVTPWEYLRSQPGVILHYLKLTFWPDDLCLDYLWPIATRWTRIYPQGLVVLGLLAASVVGLRFRPRLAFLGLAFFLVLAPTSSFVPIVDLAFEHRMYLPLACVVALTVIAFHEVTRRWITRPRDRTMARGIALVVVLLVLAARTDSRNLDYRDQVRMWSDVVSKAPHNYSAYNNLAMHLAARGRAEEAIEAYERSIGINPDYAKTHDNFGNLFARQGRFEQAEARYRTAIATDPGYAPAHLHLGLVLSELGRFDEAVTSLRKALELDAGSLVAAKRLAWILATAPDRQVRNGREAVALAERARAAADDFRTLDVLAAAYAEAGRWEDAVRTARRALREAERAGADEHAGQTRARLRLYEEGRPFRDASMSRPSPA